MTPRYHRLPPDQQPPVAEWVATDDIFIKQMLIKKAGTFIPQHSHVYDHVSMLAVGTVKVWIDGVYEGEHTAPEPIVIKAGKKHLFQAVVDDCLLYCIHRLKDGMPYPEIAEEHNIT